MTTPPGPGPGPTTSDACDVELLALFGAGELDAAQREAVSAHLVDCDRCWDDLCAQRVVIRAVQQLWEPAPAGLRADIHAAVMAEAPSHRAPGRPQRRVMLTAAALVAAISGAGIAATQLPSPLRQRPQVTAIPSAVQAAIRQADTTPPTDSPVPAAPELGRLGLHLASSGSTTADGVPAARYTYADPTGHRLTVFVAARAWPRPPRATAVNDTAWTVTPTAVTVVGGADRAGDGMLVIARDHTAAMTAAAVLGLI